MASCFQWIWLFHYTLFPYQGGSNLGLSTAKKTERASCCNESKLECWLGLAEKWWSHRQLVVLDDDRFNWTGLKNEENSCIDKLRNTWQCNKVENGGTEQTGAKQTKSNDDKLDFKLLKTEYRHHQRGQGKRGTLNKLAIVLLARIQGFRLLQGEGQDPPQM